MNDPLPTAAAVSGSVANTSIANGSNANNKEELAVAVATEEASADVVADKDAADIIAKDDNKETATDDDDAGPDANANVRNEAAETDDKANDNNDNNDDNEPSPEPKPEDDDVVAAEAEESSEISQKEEEEGADSVPPTSAETEGTDATIAAPDTDEPQQVETPRGETQQPAEEAALVVDTEPVKDVNSDSVAAEEDPTSSEAYVDAHGDSDAVGERGEDGANEQGDDMSKNDNDNDREEGSETLDLGKDVVQEASSDAVAAEAEESPETTETSQKEKGDRVPPISAEDTDAMIADAAPPNEPLQIKAPVVEAQQPAEEAAMVVDTEPVEVAHSDSVAAEEDPTLSLDTKSNVDVDAVEEQGGDDKKEQEDNMAGNYNHMGNEEDVGKDIAGEESPVAATYETTPPASLEESPTPTSDNVEDSTEPLVVEPASTEAPTPLVSAEEADDQKDTPLVSAEEADDEKDTVESTTIDTDNKVVEADTVPMGSMAVADTTIQHTNDATELPSDAANEPPNMEMSSPSDDTPALEEPGTVEPTILPNDNSDAASAAETPTTVEPWNAGVAAVASKEETPAPTVEPLNDKVSHEATAAGPQTDAEEQIEDEKEEDHEREVAPVADVEGVSSVPDAVADEAMPPDTELLVEATDDAGSVEEQERENSDKETATSAQTKEENDEAGALPSSTDEALKETENGVSQSIKNEENGGHSEETDKARAPGPPVSVEEEPLPVPNEESHPTSAKDKGESEAEETVHTTSPSAGTNELVPSPSPKEEDATMDATSESTDSVAPDMETPTADDEAIVAPDEKPDASLAKEEETPTIATSEDETTQTAEASSSVEVHAPVESSVKESSPQAEAPVLINEIEADTETMESGGRGQDDTHDPAAENATPDGAEQRVNNEPDSAEPFESSDNSAVVVSGRAITLGGGVFSEGSGVQLNTEPMSLPNSNDHAADGTEKIPAETVGDSAETHAVTEAPEHDGAPNSAPESVSKTDPVIERPESVATVEIIPEPSSENLPTDEAAAADEKQPSMSNKYAALIEEKRKKVREVRARSRSRSPDIEIFRPPTSRATVNETKENNGNSSPPPAPESSPKQTNSQAEKRVLVLMSLQSFDREVVANQQTVKTVLADIKVDHDILDGADPANKARRNELFEISGVRAKYPQFFLVDGSDTRFWGGWDEFQAANDSGTIVDDFCGTDRAEKSTDGTAQKQDADLPQAASPTTEPLQASKSAKSVSLNVTQSETPERHVLILISLQSLNREVGVNQQQAYTVLDANGIKYKTLDGANPANKTRRNELFFLSEIRAQYPQFFVVEKDNSTSFWGDWERFKRVNESGRIPATLGGLIAPVSQPTTHDTKEPEKRLLVLVSLQSIEREVVSNQQKTTTILDLNGVNYTTFDGADPANKTKRNELFFLSGIRAKYPQFFSQENGNTKFWGDWEKFKTTMERKAIEAEFKEFIPSTVKDSPAKAPSPPVKAATSSPPASSPSSPTKSPSSPVKVPSSPLKSPSSSPRSKAPVIPPPPLASLPAEQKNLSSPRTPLAALDGRIALTSEMWQTMGCPL